jgi:hypothetical protein
MARRNKFTGENLTPPLSSVFICHLKNDQEQVRAKLSIFLLFSNSHFAAGVRREQQNKKLKIFVSDVNTTSLSARGMG